MTTLNKITELETQINSAKTYNADGRNIVVNACRELYNLIEKDYHTAGADELIEDMYNDLTQGNFAEPFLCEQKKSKFELYKTIYISNILPKIREVTTLKTTVYRVDDYTHDMGDLVGFYKRIEEAKQDCYHTIPCESGQGNFSQITEFEVETEKMADADINDNETMLHEDIWGNGEIIKEYYFE